MKPCRSIRTRKLDAERYEKNREMWKELGPKIVELIERVEALEAKLK